jgi:hypothetical protein
MSNSTRFDPFIQAVFRKTETINSKMSIKRDESQDLTRRKKGDGNTEISPIPWEDLTEVSVIALRGFLEDLLGLTHPNLSPDLTMSNHSPIPAPLQDEAHQKAAKAAMAYRTTGKMVHDENLHVAPATPSFSVPDEGSGVTLGSDFGEVERAIMLGYRQSLIELERRGVEFLSLKRTLNFLDSIGEAIEQANI